MLKVIILVILFCSNSYALVYQSKNIKDLIPTESDEIKCNKISYSSSLEDKISCGKYLFFTLGGTAHYGVPNRVLNSLEKLYPEFLGENLNKVGFLQYKLNDKVKNLGLLKVRHARPFTF